MLIQEPYIADGGKIRGFGLSTSKFAVGNRTDGTRPMAGIDCNSNYEPLELLQDTTLYRDED